MVCQVLAPREYVSPRERTLTQRENETRNVAYELKEPHSWGASIAAIEMAPFVGPADVLVPIPDRHGSTRANRQLAKQISRMSGAPICDALTRRLVVKSSREQRVRGLPPLSMAAHQMLRLHGCPPGRVVFVDNVVTTGGTVMAAAEALDVPCAVLAWAWHTPERAAAAELRANPVPAQHGWHCVGHAGSVPQMKGPWDATDYLEICVGLDYLRPFHTNAVLDLANSWPDISKAEAEERVRDGDSWWQAYVWDPFNSRWYTVVEKGETEETEHFQDRDQALRRLELITRDIADARVKRLPTWRTEDVGEYLKWFQTQMPNRIDYVRLFWDNDPNGQYDGLLAEPVREAEEVFAEVFEESLADNPWVDRLSGGQADKLTPGDFDQAALARGTRVELEHTSDPQLATEIAMDHLTEDRAYYTKLALVHANPEDLRELLNEADWEGIVVEEHEDEEDLFSATIDLECKTVGDYELDEDHVLPWLGRILNALAASPTAQLAFKGRGFGRYKPGRFPVTGEAVVYGDELTIFLELDPDDPATRKIIWALSDLDVEKLQTRLTKVCREQAGKGLKSESGDLAKRYGKPPRVRTKPVPASVPHAPSKRKRKAKKKAAEQAEWRRAGVVRTSTEADRARWAATRESDKKLAAKRKASAEKKAAAKKKAKRKASKKKPAKKKAKRKAAKKAPARKAAKRKPKARPERGPEVDIIELARRARGETNPHGFLLDW